MHLLLEKEMMQIQRFVDRNHSYNVYVIDIL
jgi:hypothetical protein